MDYRIIHGDSREVLKGFDADSLHACVTDPPYELAFMGKKWDATGIAHDPAFWREVLRVLKPGAHVVAFGGTRTFHRLTVALEDAGFEIRDCLSWLFGSGFPKSLNVSKAIDKQHGAERERVAEGKPVKRMIPGADQNATGSWIKDNGREFTPTVTVPATDDAREWDGYGTALKPAWEPIILARKPLSESSVARNVLRWGTGALNIDGCRIAGARPAPVYGGAKGNGKVYGHSAKYQYNPDTAGRWPANVCLDEEAAAALDEQSGELAGGGFPAVRNAKGYSSDGLVQGDTPHGAYSMDSGGASRFFYVAKPDVAERDQGTHYLTERTRNRVNAGGLENDPKWAPKKAGNSHPTVKPVSLMRWLVRMATAPGATVLDPFLGSGTTMMAAIGEDRGCIGIEQDEHWCELAEARASSVAPLLVRIAID